MEREDQNKEDQHKEAKDQDEKAEAEDRYQNMSTRYGLVESAIDDFARRGGFDDLPGKGKPHKIDDEDVFSSILKKNNYQPPWAELRKEIAADLKRLADNPRSDHELRAELEAVNDKIRTYNRIVPHPMLQKGLVSRANLENAYPKWV